MNKALFLSISVLFFIGCNNNKTASADSPDQKSAAPTSSARDNVISFKVNGEEVISTDGNIRRFTWSNQSDVWINITSDIHKGKGTINVNLNGAKPGSYIFDSEGAIMEKSHGSYHSDLSSYSFVSGSFVITDVDTVHNFINGTFSVTAKSTNGETINITDGKIIKGTLKPGIISL